VRLYFLNTYERGAARAKQTTDLAARIKHCLEVVCLEDATQLFFYFLRQAAFGNLAS
jgi:hypothetical protein